MALGWCEERGTFYPISVLREIFTAEGIELGLGDPGNQFKQIRIKFSQLTELVSTVFLFNFREYPNTATCPVYPPKILKERSKKTTDKSKLI